MRKKFHLTVSNNDTNIADYLTQYTQLSKQRIKQAMQKGAVWLENERGVRRVRRVNKKAQCQHIIHCYYDENILQQTPATPTLIKDEIEYSVWLKPSGMHSQGSKWSDHCTIHRWIEQHYRFEQQAQRNCFIIHCLDKATSGLMMIGHTKRKTAELAEQFQQRQIEKYYYAIVAGQLHKLEKNEDGKIIIDTLIDDKKAKTIINAIHYNSETNRSLLDIKIETGRKHQIRKHLSQLGYPIIGDRLYSPHSDHCEDLQLTAYCIKILNTDYQLPREKDQSIRQTFSIQSH